MKKQFLFFVLWLFFACNVPQVSELRPTTLEECGCYEDSVYVIDFWSYTPEGKLKPPCSLSPDYKGCMAARGIIIR